MSEKLSKTKVKKAGEKLKKDIETDDDLVVISTFRTNHIRLMKMLVGTISKKMPPPILLARRLKRLSSIKLKLLRFSNMDLSRMQDIGGVRAVFKNDKDAFEFVKNVKDAYLKKNTALNIINENDYISKPKKDGYRSYHLIFQYNGKIDEVKDYKIELQVRSLLHHYWATAVEILALNSTSNLKAGYGEEHVKKFFYLVGELFAGKTEYIEEIKQLDEKHNITALLDGLKVTANKLTENKKDKNSLYLAVLDYKRRVLNLVPFREENIEQAKVFYRALESEKDKETVLVSVDDIKKLKRAYPNYYLDATKFLKELKERLVKDK